MAVKIHYQYKDYGDDKKATEISHNNAASRAQLSPLIGIGFFVGVFIMADGFSRKDYQILIGGALLAAVIYYFLYSAYVSPIDDDIEVDNYRIQKYESDQSIPIGQKKYLDQKLENDRARRKVEIKVVNRKALKYIPIVYIVGFLISLFL